ncbi:hypothetical protein R6Q59_019862 [Mikania micrantha]
MILQEMTIQRLKGPVKRGYVRLVGRMPATKDKGDSEINSQTIHQLQSVVHVMMNSIHEHIPNANLSTVLHDMNIRYIVLVHQLLTTVYLETSYHLQDLMMMKA